MLNNIVDNIEQCGQQDIVQSNETAGSIVLVRGRGGEPLGSNDHPLL